MTAQNEKLSAIKTSLLKMAQEIGQPAAPAPAAPAAGSPEEVLELIDNAIEVLEVAEQSIPAEKPEAAPAAPVVAKSNTKSAQEEEEDEEDKQKEAQEEEEDEEKKEMTARIAALESELDGRKRQAIAEEIANQYPEDVRQAKYEEIVADTKTPFNVLEANLKVAKDINESVKPTNVYRPAKSEGGYLKTARLQKPVVSAWRT